MPKAYLKKAKVARNPYEAPEINPGFAPPGYHVKREQAAQIIGVDGVPERQFSCQNSLQSVDRTVAQMAYSASTSLEGEERHRTDATSRVICWEPKLRGMQVCAGGMAVAEGAQTWCWKSCRLCEKPRKCLTFSGWRWRLSSRRERNSGVSPKGPQDGGETTQAVLVTCRDTTTTTTTTTTTMMLLRRG